MSSVIAQQSKLVEQARRRVCRLAIVAFAAIPLGSLACAEGISTEQVVVTLDNAKLVKIPAHVDTIVIGNPSIADITMIKKNGLMVVTGKGFGETNAIFLDAAGQAVSEATITVEPSKALLTVQRGMDRESYSCTPRCEPAVALGDNTKYLADTSGRITTGNAMMVPGGGH